MSDLRARLEDKLGRRPKTPADAERAARAAEALAAYLRLEERVDDLLAEGAPDAAQEQVEAAKHEASLAGLTLHDAAEEVLERAGRPLHVQELGKRIKARGWSHPRSQNPRPDQIQYQLAARLPRHSERFRRVAPNTFGLAKWRHKLAETKARPRIGLFAGPGDVARKIEKGSDEVVEAHAWR